MNRSRVLFLVLSIVVLVPMVSGMLWSQVTERRGGDAGGDSLYKSLAIFSEVFGLVRNNYVDETDPGHLLAGAMDGATDALDPFSAFVPKEARADYERALAVGKSHSGLTVVKDHGIAYALAVDEGSPAETAGILPGDLLAEIGGLSTRELSLGRIQGILAGEPGTALETKFLRQGDSKSTTLTLAAYPAPEPRLEEVRGVALLRVRGFGPATALRTSSAV